MLGKLKIHTDVIALNNLVKFMAPETTVAANKQTKLTNTGNDGLGFIYNTTIEHGLALFYVSRADWEKVAGEYLLCFEEGDSYIHFCDDDTIPKDVYGNADNELLIRVDGHSDGFPQAELVAKFLFERIIVFADDLFMFQCRDGHSYGYSCAKAINDFFKSNTSLFSGNKIGSLVCGPGENTPHFKDEDINKYAQGRRRVWKTLRSL